MSDDINTAKGGPKTADSALAASADVAEAIRIADEIERQRKSAPVVMGGVKTRIKAKEIIDRYASRTGGQDAKGGRHYFFVPNKDMKDWAYRGAKPEVDKGMLVRNESDVLVSTTTEQYRQTLADNQRLDVATRLNLAEKTQADAAASTVAKGTKVEVHEPGSTGHTEALRAAGVK